VHDPVCRHTPLTSGIDAAATPSKRSAASNMHFQFDDVARSFFFPRQRGSLRRGCTNTHVLYIQS
jgi:hypothetical protein